MEREFLFPVKKMIGILHTEWSKGWGGQEIRIIEESLEFIKRGYRMMIACQPDSRIFRVAQENGVPVIPLKMRIAMDPLAIWKCRQIIKRNSIDIVHTHSSVDSWCCSIASKLVGVPVIRSRHISAPINTNVFSFFLYMKLANRVISSGKIIKKKMVEVNGYDPQKIISIPTGVNEKTFSPEINGPSVREELKIRKDDFLLGIVAMLRSWKGHLYLLEAVKELQEKIPNIKLLIAGDGPQEETIRNTIRDNGLTGTVIMTGYRKDVPQILRSLDLCVLPSYSNEGAPQAILQAMALGVPIIATSAGGIEEVVKDGQTGTLVPPRDVQALSKAINWAYQNREECLKMAHKASELIWNNFTLTRMTDKTEGVYRELLGWGRPEQVAVLPANVSPIKFKSFRQPKFRLHFFRNSPLSNPWSSRCKECDCPLPSVKPKKLLTKQ
ncbi:MAG: glycosyltransferase family 4 protein [Thermodesulfobacteriota bacterium]